MTPNTHSATPPAHIGTDQRWRWLLLLIATLASVVLDAASFAQTAPLGFDRFKHTRWSPEDGATLGNYKMIQTPDGWIWIAGVGGLWRFDGTTFEQIPAIPGSKLEHANATALLQTRSGELWIGYGQGAGVGIYRHGRVEPVPMPRPPAQVMDLQQTSDGAIWLTRDGAYLKDRQNRFRNGRWDKPDDALHLPYGAAQPPCITADGTMWVILDRDTYSAGLAYLPPGGTRFLSSAYKLPSLAHCAIDPKGRLWFSDKTGIRLAFGADGKPVSKAIRLPGIPGVEEMKLVFDANGGVWGLTALAGLYYVPDVDAWRSGSKIGPYRFNVADGLNSGPVNAAFVDHERNIWIGNELGLEKFHPISVVQARIGLSGLSEGFGMAQSGDEIYINGDKSVLKIAPGPIRTIYNHVLAGNCAARRGGMWGADDRGIILWQNGRLQEFPAPKGVETAGTCAEDRFGRFWMALNQNQLMYLDARGWHTPKRPLPPMELQDVILTQSGDIAYLTHEDLVRVVGDEAVVTKLSGYHLGQFTLLRAGGRDLFVGGVNGLLRVRGPNVVGIDVQRAPWLGGLRDMIQTANGDTWMLRRQTLSKILSVDLDRSFDDPHVPLKRALFDQRDGFTLSQQMGYRGPQMASGSDGRVWFLTLSGVASIDPAKVDRKPILAAPVIRSLSISGRQIRDPSNLTLPAGTRAVDIEYTALRLSDSKHARFRYRLVGLDNDWVEPGNRRVASFDNLGPGHYQFEVFAADDRGPWSAKPVTLNFEIKPTFFERLPFKLLCCLLILAVLWLLFSLRLRIIASRIRLRMAERLDERERIARELHDTLLQGFHGLLLRLQAVANKVPRTESARLDLEQVMDKAEAVLVEGRDRVRELRFATGDIAAVLVETAEQLVATSSSKFSISIEGTPRDLHPAAATEIQAIAEEAIRNAFQHARARTIDAKLIYRRGELCFQLLDDGVGLTAEIAVSGERRGHYGLIGMRERAARIGGKLTIVSHIGAGTEVSLLVPGSAAYATQRGTWRSFPFIISQRDQYRAA